MSDFPSFFTDVDRHERRPDRDPSSAFPAWYFQAQIDNVEGRIAQIENQLKMGLVRPESVMNYRHEASQLRERLAEVKASKIKLSPKQKDQLAAFYKRAGELLQDSMPTRSQMNKGLANAHTELKLNTTPVFGVSGYESILKAMNIKIVSGKVSRNSLSIAWKIAGRYLEQESNTEYLRKDMKTNTYQLDKSIEELEQGA